MGWIEEYDDLKDKCKKLRKQLKRLKKAGNDLYEAGYWVCTKSEEESRKLWEALRDALGRKKGTSPKPKKPTELEQYRKFFNDNYDPLVRIFGGKKIDDMLDKDFESEGEYLKDIKREMVEGDLNEK